MVDYWIVCILVRETEPWRFKMGGEQDKPVALQSLNTRLWYFFLWKRTKQNSPTNTEISELQ